MSKEKVGKKKKKKQKEKRGCVLMFAASEIIIRVFFIYWSMLKWRCMIASNLCLFMGIVIGLFYLFINMSVRASLCVP
jgi:hypothetical protein